MKTSHLSNRAWRNNATTCWIRGCDENAISLGYRLFRRSSVTRAFWSEPVAFDGCDSRDYIAATLRAARNALRDRVDAADLKALLPEVCP